MTKKKSLQKQKITAPSTTSGEILEDLCRLIEQSRETVASTINVCMNALYWNIGHRIRMEILGEKRAGYVRSIVAKTSRQLTIDYGNGFCEEYLRKAIQFAEAFPDEQIAASLMRQLNWSHFLILIPIKDNKKRAFYAEMCRAERWNVRTLRKQMDSMLYERNALSKKPIAVMRAELDKLPKEDRLTPDLVLRDPFVLEFLQLNDRYVEKDIEDAIIRELEQFLLELGTGFSFLARRKRFTVDDEDFYIDLLFFHRDLKRLVAIAFKLEDFKPEHKGQMGLSLRWLDKHERRPNEGPPVGLILCAGKRMERIELLELDHSGIRIAEYLTILPPKKILKEKLQKAIEHAKRLECKAGGV